MNKYLVSSCLLGTKCNYKGEDNINDELIEFLKDKEYIKVCPEVLGGLSIPRLPSEINGDQVLNKENKDVTEYFVKGANKTLDIALLNNCNIAILKSNSPSCSNMMIYDGTFNKKLIHGKGITANILECNNIKVYSERQLKKLKEDTYE